MAQSDGSTPRFLDLSKLNPPMVLSCDVHSTRKVVIQFNPPAANAQNQVPVIADLYCIDCWRDTIPQLVRSVS